MRILASSMLLLAVACGGVAQAPSDGVYDCYFLGGPDGAVIGLLHGKGSLAFDDDGKITGTMTLGTYEGGVVTGHMSGDLGFELQIAFAEGRVVVTAGRWVPMARLEGPAVGLGFDGAFRARHLGFAQGKPSQPTNL